MTSITIANSRGLMLSQSGALSDARFVRFKSSQTMACAKKFQGTEKFFVEWFRRKQIAGCCFRGYPDLESRVMGS